METIKLDLIPGKKMPSLHASQFDDGRTHGIDLFENGVVYKLDGTETLTINERKGDNCICSLDIENTFADSNHIVFASTEQMCAVWGNNICELVITKGEKTIGTLNFILEIEPSPTENGIESESEISNLERQIEEITEQVIGDNYYTAEETDDAIATATEGKADTTYVNTELGKKADKSNTYTKTETDNLVSPKADKTYVDNVADTKADKDTTYTKSEVDTLIDNLPEPMIFKGTLGVNGTIQTLPTASASNEGWTYKVITDGTYAGQTAKVGDVFTSNGSEWVLIPSGDEDNDTWRAIKVEGVEKLGNGISSGAVDFVGSENIEVDFDGNGNKVGVKTKNIYTKEQVDDIVYNILPDDTASGAVANFNTSLELPIKSLEVDVNAVQEAGTPTPSSPKAISGWNAITLDANGNTEVINLGGTYYGGHFTQDKDGHRQFEVTHGIKSFSDIAFNYSNNAGQWQHFLFYGAINDKLSTSLTLLCTNYEDVNEQLSTISNGKMLVASWGNYIYIRDDAYTTVADFKTANANTQVVYTLATPIVIDLPDGEPIITLNGTNNIYADTGDSAVVFKCSVSDYVSAHSGGNLLGMGGVYLGGAKNGGSEEETDEGEDTEKTKLDDPKEEIKTIGDTKKLGGE